MKVFGFTLDLRDDPGRVEAYIHHHQNVWPEVIASIRKSGIYSMEIYQYSTRLFMRIETTDDFTFEHKAKLDADNPAVQEWEELMWRYQAKIEGSKPGEKWVRMDRIFDL